MLKFTGRTAISDRISALHLGADDYPTDDVEIDYLVARVEALRSCVGIQSESPSVTRLSRSRGDVAPVTQQGADALLDAAMVLLGVIKAFGLPALVRHDSGSGLFPRIEPTVTHKPGGYCVCNGRYPAGACALHDERRGQSVQHMYGCQPAVCPSREVYRSVPGIEKGRHKPLCAVLLASATRVLEFAVFALKAALSKRIAAGSPLVMLC